MSRSREGRRLRLAGAAGVVLLATRLAAQTLPVPALPPEPRPEPSPGPSAQVPLGAPPSGADAFVAPEPARPRAWEYALGAGVGWDSNIDFLVPDGPRALALAPRGGLARVFSGPQGQVRVSAAGGWTGYPAEEDLSRYHADVGLDGTYRASPDTTWRASASHGLGHSDSSRILLEQGVSLPVVKTRSITAALGLRKGPTRRPVRIDVRFYRTEFDSSTLIDGSSVRGTVGLERQISRRSTAALEYSLEDVLSDQRGHSYLTHFASLQWTRVLSPRSALLLEAGASYTPDAARASLEREESFFGGASFSRQVRRSGVTAFVRREVTPAFGLGVSRLELRAGLGATVPIGRRWELRIVASHVQPGAPRDGARLYGPSDDAFAALGRRLGRHFEVSGEARYRRRAATSTLPAIQAFNAGLYVTLLSPSGRAILPASSR